MDLMFIDCKNLKSLDLSSFVLSPDVIVENIFGGIALEEEEPCVVKCTVEAYPKLYEERRWYNVEFEIADDGDGYESTDFSKDGNVISLQKASAGQGVNLIIMGDGYSDRMISDGTYHAMMQKSVEDIFDVEPFKALRHLFNIYEIEIVSKNEYVVPGSETAFGTESVSHGSSFYYNCDLEKGGITYHFTPYTPSDYGAGMSVAIIGKSDESANFKHLIQHECGHAIGKLADEYYYDGTAYEYVLTSLTNYQNNYGWYRNISVTSDLTQVPWKDFIGDSRYASEEIGAYEGAYEYAYGIWRPTSNSMMREENMYSIFNAPSRALIYYRLNKLAFGEEWEYDYE